MLRRLKRAWQLAKHSEEELAVSEYVLEHPSVVELPEKLPKPRSKGKADGAFLEDMTDEQYADWEREQDTIWNRFMEKVRNLK